MTRFSDVVWWDNLRLFCFVLFFCCVGDWGLNSGLCTCKAGAVPLEPHLQSVLLWFLEMRSYELFAQAGLELLSCQSWPPK
jgi:hypothetical protein